MEISNSQKTTGNEIEEAKKNAAIEAVKLVRRRLGCGLAEAKAFIDEIRKGGKPA